MAYTDLLLSSGHINASELMSMAHRKAKAQMETEEAAVKRWPDHIKQTYAAALRDALVYFWAWGRSMEEYHPRRIQRVATPEPMFSEAA